MLRAGALPAWLVGIARNFARRRAAVPDDPVVDDDEPDPSPTPEDRLAGKRGVESLRQAIAELPPRYRDVLILVELAERSYAEAAFICGCELNTVRSRLSRARALLVRRLGFDDATSPVAPAVTAVPADWRLTVAKPTAPKESP